MNREHEDDERSTAELHRSLPLNAMSQQRHHLHNAAGRSAIV
jgi:hypothetical protein